MPKAHFGGYAGIGRDREESNRWPLLTCSQCIACRAGVRMIGLIGTIVPVSQGSGAKLARLFATRCYQSLIAA